MNPSRYITELARDLRRNQIPSENLLWEKLRSWKLKLRELVLRVLRFKNEELDDIESVLETIGRSLTHPPAPCLQSREGETVKRKGENLQSREGGTVQRTDKGAHPRTLGEPPLYKVERGTGGESGIILLGAGSSSRMGQSKQLLLVEGEPLLLRSAKAALGARANYVVAVLGANEAPHRKLLKGLGLEIASNPDWPKGMGSSLKAGLRHLLAIAPGTSAVIVMVCDQPNIHAHHLKTLLDNFLKMKYPIVASRYSGIIGVPALFDKSLFPAIFKLEDDQGAKMIIKQHPELVSAVDFPGGEIDLDTPEDYKTFTNK